MNELSALPSSLPIPPSWHRPRRAGTLSAVPPLIPLLVSGAALMFGGAVEAATGYGSAVVALPVLDLAFPSHMPALLILLGPPLVLLMAGVERRHIDVPAVAGVSSGLVLGSLAAIPVLDLMSGRSLRLLFGCATLVALVVMTTLRGGVARTAPRSFAAGTVSGFMGTATGIAGPPLAVVFARDHGAAVRATLGVIYTVGAAFSIGALLLARRIDLADLWLAVLLTTPVVAGFAAGRLVLRRVSARFLRAVVLAVVAASAAVLFLGAV